MKTITSSGQDLVSISTVVYYCWHPFLPDEVPVGDLSEVILNDSKSSKVLYLSDEESSDLIEFAEYNFDYKPDKSKYKRYLKSNYFDSYTRDKIGIEYNSLKLLSDCIFPQSSKEVDTNTEGNYFGMITVSNQSVILLDIPGESWEIIDTEEIKRLGVWKVEIYNQSLTKNNSVFDGFIEYDTLVYLGLHNSLTDPSPSLTITFGPTRDIKNNSSEMYYTDGVYNIPNMTLLSSSEYKTLTQEISDRKVSYIIISSDGTLKDINLSYASWGLSNNPNRNQKNYSLRNDNYLSTRDSANILGNFPGSSMIHDKVSHTLIGTKKLNLQEDCPIISNKISRARNIYSPNIPYQMGSEVNVNGRSWVSSISGNIGQDPEYSNYWELSKEEDWSLGESDYIHLFISSNGKEKGSIFPIGNITINRESELTFTVTPSLGYYFPLKEDLESGKVTTDLIMIGLENFYCRNIELNGNQVTLKGVTDPNDIKFLFKEIKSRIFFEMYVENDWIMNEGNEAYYRYPNFAIGTSITSTINGVVTSLDSSGLLLVDIGDKVEIKINTLSSDYILENISYRSSTGVFNVIQPTSDGSILIDRVDFSYRSYQVNLRTKKYECKLIETLGAEVNKYGEYLNWGEPFVLKFYSQPGYIYEGVELYYTSTGELVNDTSVYLLDSSPTVKTLTIISVVSDFSIKLKFREE